MLRRFVTVNKDLSFALRLEKEPNVARFGYSRKIPKITEDRASNVGLITVLRVRWRLV